MKDEQKEKNDATVEFFCAFGEFTESLRREDWGIIIDGREVPLPDNAKLVVLDRAKDRIARRCANNWSIRER